MKLTAEQLKGQNGTCPTIQVKMKDGGATVTINAHDFDEEVHTRITKKKDDDSGEASNAGSRGSPDFTSYTVAELKEHLEAKGVAFSKDDRKDDLVALAVKAAG